MFTNLLQNFYNSAYFYFPRQLEKTICNGAFDGSVYRSELDLMYQQRVIINYDGSDKRYRTQHSVYTCIVIVLFCNFN